MCKVTSTIYRIKELLRADPTVRELDRHIEKMKHNKRQRVPNAKRQVPTIRTLGVQGLEPRVARKALAAQQGLHRPPTTEGGRENSKRGGRPVTLQEIHIKKEIGVKNSNRENETGNKTRKIYY